jgi:hypothetical protein
VWYTVQRHQAHLCCWACITIQLQNVPSSQVETLHPLSHNSLCPLFLVPGNCYSILVSVILTSPSATYERNHVVFVFRGWFILLSKIFAAFLSFFNVEQCSLAVSTSFCSFSHPLMDIWVGSTSWSLWITLL